MKKDPNSGDNGFQFKRCLVHERIVLERQHRVTVPEDDPPANLAGEHRMALIFAAVAKRRLSLSERKECRGKTTETALLVPFGRNEPSSLIESNCKKKRAMQLIRAGWSSAPPFMSNLSGTCLSSGIKVGVTETARGFKKRVRHPHYPPSLLVLNGGGNVGMIVPGDDIEVTAGR